MGRSTRVAISLPEELLAAAERARKEVGESRSEFFRTALEQRLEEAGTERATTAYVNAYVEQPESPDDAAAALQLAVVAAATEPW